MIPKTDGIYAMYLRKSRADIEAEARGQYETLAHHLQILTELADRYGIRIYKTYREIVSGDSIDGRPQMQALLSEVENGVYDGVLVTEISRLARGRTKDQGIVAEAFRKTGTLIITPSKIYDPTDDADETFFDFELFMARQEYKYIKKRMQRGRELSRQNGNWIFPHVPVGYKKDGLCLVPDEKATIMKAALLEFGNGRRNLTKTIVFLKTALPERKWNISTVRRTLTNPIYAGYIRRGKEAPNASTLDLDSYTKANCEPIISIEDHIAIVQRIVPRPRMKDGLTLRNAFAGLIRCKNCGRAIVYSSNRGTPVLTHQHGIDIPPCPCSQVRYDVAYQLITDTIISHLPYVEYEQEEAVDEEQIEELKKRLKRAEQIKAELFQKLEDGIYTASEFKERKTIREQEIEALKGQIEALEGIKKKHPVKIDTDDLIEVLRDGDPALVNDVLRVFVDHIEYKKESRRHPPAFEVFYL